MLRFLGVHHPGFNKMYPSPFAKSGGSAILLKDRLQQAAGGIFLQTRVAAGREMFDGGQKECLERLYR